MYSWRLLLTDRCDLRDTGRREMEAIALTGMTEGKRAREVDKGKRLWTGYLSLVRNMKMK